MPFITFIQPDGTEQVVDADSAEPVPRFVGNSYVNPEKPTVLQIP